MKATAKTPKTAAPSALWLALMTRHRWKIVAAIALLAFLIRIWRVGFLSLWIDEYVHAVPAKQFLDTGSFSVADNNGILLTWINCLLVKCLGLSEWVLRLPSVLSGSLLVPVAYAFGKKLWGTATGLITALLVCFSPFLVFWSRIDRMYEFVSLFYLLSLLCFWLLVEDSVLVLRMARKNKLIGKTALLCTLLLCFLLAFLSQIQALLFLLSIGFYGSFVFLHGRFASDKTAFRKPLYRWLLIANLAGLLLFFTPLSNLINKPILTLINGSEGLSNARIPGWVAAMLAPDWKAFGDFIGSDDWLKYFNTYRRVTLLDYPVLGIAGWFGFALGFFRQKKSAYFLVSAFIMPLLVMGFFLREPNEPRYLCFIYPVFLCAIAVALRTVCLSLLPKLFSKRSSAGYSNGWLAFTAVLIMALLPYRAVFSLILSEKHGHQLQRELTEPAIVNWKEPAVFVKERIRPGDLVFATVSGVADLYIGQPTLPFRQFHYSLEQKKYLPNPVDTLTTGANSYEAFLATVNRHPRGWLLLDHYVNTEYADTRVVDYVHRYFRFHPEASRDGSVQVFSWDRNNWPAGNSPQYMVELGKDFAFDQVPSPFGKEDQNQYSNILQFNTCASCDSVEIHFFTRNIDYRGEASILLNENKSFIIPLPADTASGESSLRISLRDGGIVPGKVNSARFVYSPAEEASNDAAKGYCLTYFYFRWL